MNDFRLCGDVMHLVSFWVLLLRIWLHKSSAGISGKSQILLALVFTTRYLDLFITFYSQYNFDMKIIYLLLSYVTVISIYTKFRGTYEKENDGLYAEFLAAFAVVLSIKFTNELTILEICWTFSQFLEAVAMWPQFYMIYKTKNVSRIIFLYLALVGMYRILYIANWVYRYCNEGHYDLISSISGGVEIVPYVLLWVLCTFKVVKITKEESSWYSRNLVDRSNGIFTIEVGKPDSAPLVKN